MILERDLYWLAGLLEGEGSFMMPTPSAQPSQIKASLHMTDDDVVQRVCDYWGVSQRTGNMLPSGKQVWKVDITGAKAASWMRVLKPLMGQRRQARIEEILNYYDAYVATRKKKYKSDNVIVEVAT